MKPQPDAHVRVIDLFPAPFPSHLCLACGCDPADIWEGHWIVGRDETKTLNADRHCEACAEARQTWLHRP